MYACAGDRDYGRESDFAMRACLEQLDRDMATLFGVERPQGAHILFCPVCETNMLVDSEKTLPPVEKVECRVRRLVCPRCGMWMNRIFNTSFGYAPFEVW